MHTSRPQHEQPDIPADVLARRWTILGLLCLNLVIVIIGNTSLNVAIPRLSEDLGASNTALQWMVDAYSLVFAGMLLTAGSLGDRFGRKGALQLGLAIFGVASLAAAMSQSSGQVIAARAVMGLGGAFVMPSTLSMISNVFPEGERAKAIAIWAGVAGAGGAIGPLASGFLLGHFWWGSTFLVNIPIIAAAILIGHFILPKSSDPTDAPLDLVGALLSILGMSALVYAIIEAPEHGWLSPESFLTFGIAVVLLTVFALWERSLDQPMLNLSFFADRRFSVSSGGIMLLFFSLFGTIFLATQYLQLIAGYSPLEAGVRLLPQSIVMVALAPQAPKAVNRFGANVVAGAGLFVIAASLALLAVWGAGTSYAFILGSLIVMAAGMAFTMAPLTAELMSSIPPAKAGVGSAMNDTTRELGGALGVALFGSIVAGQYASGIADRLASFPADIRAVAGTSLSTAMSLAQSPGQVGTASGRAIQSAAESSFLDGFHLASVLGAVSLAVAGVLVIRLLPSSRFDPLVAEGAGVGSGDEPDLPGVEGDDLERAANPG
ncbi:MAG TPA: MFS transporter [Acidimicrobiales bacterium]|jgi:EmrB/QacA subfamily drug resistance transporter